MPTQVRPSRSSQIIAWIVATLFVLGFFVSRVEPGPAQSPVCGSSSLKAPARIPVDDGHWRRPQPDLWLAQDSADWAATGALSYLGLDGYRCGARPSAIHLSPTGFVKGPGLGRGFFFPSSTPPL